MAQTPTFEPATIQAGDTVRWQRDLSDYPASDGWVLNYRLINAAVKIDVVATAEGDSHLIVISAATCAAYAAGEYTWVATVTRAGERYTVGQGTITIKPDWAAASTGADARTPAAKALADLRSALLQWLSTSGHVSEYEIAGRRMRFASAQDIRERIAIAEREVARESTVASGQTGARRVLVRFG